MDIIKKSDTEIEIPQAPIQQPSRIVDVNKLVEQNKMLQARIDANNKLLDKASAVGVVPSQDVLNLNK